jgi:hypothetical protein
MCDPECLQAILFFSRCDFRVSGFNLIQHKAQIFSRLTKPAFKNPESEQSRKTELTRSELVIVLLISNATSRSDLSAKVFENE